MVLMLEAAQRQSRYREVMHRAVNAYKLLIVDEIGYLPLSREQANLFFQIVDDLLARCASGEAEVVLVKRLDRREAGHPREHLARPCPTRFALGDE